MEDPAQGQGVLLSAAAHPGGDAPTQDALDGAGVLVPEHLGGGGGLKSLRHLKWRRHCLAFFTVLFTWSDQDRFHVMVTPRIFQTVHSLHLRPTDPVDGCLSAVS